jgi:hypothetical protein
MYLVYSVRSKRVYSVWGVVMQKRMQRAFKESIFCRWPARSRIDTRKRSWTQSRVNRANRTEEAPDYGRLLEGVREAKAEFSVDESMPGRRGRRRRRSFPLAWNFIRGSL